MLTKKELFFCGFPIHSEEHCAVFTKDPEVEVVYIDDDDEDDVYDDNGDDLRCTTNFLKK